MKNLHLNLRLKLISIVIVGVLIVFSSFGAFRLYMEKKSLTEQLYRSGEERVSLVAESLANLIQAYDYSNIESLSERIVKMQDVQQINVFNRSERVMASRKSADFNPEMKVLKFASPIHFSGETIGRVELLISLERYDASIRNIYRNVLAAVSFATIFFVVLIYSTVSVLIVRPLIRLSKAAHQLEIGNYAAELPDIAQDEMGNLVQTFASMRESRKLNEERLQAVFAHSPDAFIQLDSDGNITDWNARAETIWGYTKDEVLGKNFSMVLPPQELGMNKGYRKCYQKSDNVIGVIRELVGQRKDGSYFPLELKTNEMHFEDGNAYLVSARDITERKESEAILLSAMKAAEAGSAAKSRFLSNMSHEIRTPMNSIIGMTNLALKTHLTAKQHDYLGKIDYSAKHLLSLINDILDFSKIEANKLELEILDFQLDDVFDNLSNQLVHAAASKGLALKFDLDPRLSIPLCGDPMRLTQILLNYTSNAIKFTEKGVVSISGKLLEEFGDDFLLRFEVRDTGIGMSSEEIGQIFQPFQQGDASTTRKYGGSGLGLAISKQLVELMGGMVGVESVSGQGSMFWFTAKLVKGQKRVAHVVPALLNTDLFKGMSVLLVEDNLFNQQVALEMLKDVGMVVSVAGNGKEGVDMLLERKFDCVLMDVQMPVMDGLEATRQIRSNPLLAGTYIIAMTANAGQEDRARCFAAGMDDFISKPVFADKLYDVIARRAASRRAGDNSTVRSLPARTAEASQNVSTLKTAHVYEAEAAVIDLSVLAKLLGSNSAKIQKFAGKFLQSARQGQAEIEAAIQQENLGALAALGHRNKSPAKTVGALTYAALCESLEQFKNGGDIAHAREIADKMKSLLGQIEAEINKAFS